MIILITGSSHTGKTTLAQKLLEKYKYPYLSIDHLKMGLIRSGNTNLTECKKYGNNYILIDDNYEESLKNFFNKKQVFNPRQ